MSVIPRMSRDLRLSGNVLAECDLLSLFLEFQPGKRKASPWLGQTGLSETKVQLPACQRLLEQAQLSPLGPDRWGASMGVACVILIWGILIWGSHEPVGVPSKPISINLTYSLVFCLHGKGDLEWHRYNGAVGKKAVGLVALATGTRHFFNCN